MSLRPVAVAAGLAIGALAGAAACGNKAAPDVDPPAKAAAPSSSTTTTAPTTTTTADPGTLPQTNDKPDPASPQFRARMEALWQAIVDDDPAKALPSFFPLSAYQQVKNLKDPASDWNNRLVGAFNADIHSYHKQLVTQLTQQKAGTVPIEPKFVGVDVPPKAVQWINPNVESNKIGYFRVFDSKLNYTINGKPLSFTIKSLISWRGQWYVVHFVKIQ